MKIKFSFIIVFLIIIFILFVFYKSLFENKNYIPKKTTKIENILIEEFYSGNKLKLKELFDDEKYIIINIREKKGSDSGTVLDIVILLTRTTTALIPSLPLSVTQCQ